VNFLGHDEDEERLRAAFGDNAERLREIKTRYDPDNYFRRNHNIEPLAASRG
jgi:FAD/FMN-containing dehydrogenase